MAVRNYPNTPRVYLDMDGVVADFEGEMLRLKLPADQTKLRSGTYLRLKPFPGAIEGVQRLLDFGWQVFFCTKIPSQNPGAASEKLHWVREHMPMMGDRVIITPDKGAIGTFRDILVDDHPEWANARLFPGLVIKFDAAKQSWAELLELFQTPDEYLVSMHNALHPPLLMKWAHKR